jgi:Protein of unknown function (DUF3455)
MTRRCQPVSRWPLAALTMIGVGCASPPPTVPEALRAPPDQRLAIEALATGVQIYQCTAVAGPPAHDEWVFKSPEADLSDAAGHPIGRHFAGPTWQSSDGSSVVGAVKAHDDGPDLDAIAWLLLSAKSHAGNGVFSQVTSIQRIDTHGGKAPATGCSPANEGQSLRVPYQARYRFYVPQS